MPARQNTPSDEASEFGGVQSLKDANELLQQTPGCESPGATVSSAGEGNARIAGDDGLGRISHISVDARKLVDEAVSSSLVAIAAVVGEVAQGKLSKLEFTGQPGQVEQTESPEGTPVLGNDDCRGNAERPSSVDSCRGLSTPVSASVRDAVVETFLAGVYEIVSALRAAEAAKARVVANVPTTVDPVAESLREEPSPTGNEPADRGILLNRTVDQSSPVSGAPIEECVVEVPRATASIDTENTPPSGMAIDVEVVAAKRIGDEPDSHPSPPSSASLRAVVVQDFDSATYGSIATSEADDRGVEATDVGPVRHNVDEDPLTIENELASRATQLDRAEDQTAPVASVSASKDESSVKTATAADNNSTPNDEKTRDGAERHPCPPSPTSLRAAAVVEGFVNDAYRIITMAEVGDHSVKASASVNRATGSLPEGVIPIESDSTGRATPFNAAEDQTAEDQTAPVVGATASIEDSAVRTATAVENKVTPGGAPVDAGVIDERRTGVEPDSHPSPSPPSSASLRAAVVEDFVSGMYEAVATSGGAEDRAVAEVPTTVGPATDTLSSERPVPGGKVPTSSAAQLDSAEDQPLPMAGATAANEESAVMSATTNADNARTPAYDGCPVDAEVVVDEKKARCPPDDPSLRTSTPIRTAVVSDFLSGAYETVATEAAAGAADTLIALDLTMESLSKEVGQESPIRLDGTEDQARYQALASEEEPPEEPAAIVIKEIIPIPTGSGKPPDADGADDKRTEDAPGERPSSSPLASLREVVVADFLSDAYSVVAMARSSTTTAPSVPSMHLEATLLTEEPATGPELDVSGEKKGVSPSTFAGDCPSKQQHTTTLLTKDTAPEEKEGGNEEGEEKQAVLGTCTDAETISESFLSEPIISNAVVVEEHLSDALPVTKAAEMEGTTAAAPSAATSCPVDAITDAEGVQTLPGASPPRPLGASGGTQTVGKARDVDVDTTGEDNAAAAILAMRCSIVEAMALVEQAPTTIPGETCTKKKRGEEEEGGDTPDTTRDGLCSPTPPGTPEEHRLDNVNPVLEPEFPIDPAPVDGGRLPDPRSVEAFAYLSEAGIRAKSRKGDLDQAQREAAEWLCLAAEKAQSAQDQADKARVDASSWLRDRGASALQGRVHTVVVPLFLKRWTPFVGCLSC